MKVLCIYNVVLDPQTVSWHRKLCGLS